MAGVGVGDDGRRVVHLGRVGSLGRRHARAGEALVAVSGQQGTHDAGGLVGNHAERVAGEVGAGILVRRALGGSCPTPQVDTLDSGPLHGDRLSRRVGPECRDAAARLEQLPKARLEPIRRHPGNGVVLVDRSALLDHLARRIEPRQPVEPGRRHPAAHGLEVGVEPIRHAALAGQHQGLWAGKLGR